ncbi:MAG: extracellular solute-binding protein [Angelakisella sp.]
MKKLLSMVLACIMIASVAVGCGSKPADPAPAPAPTTEAAPVPAKKVEVTAWLFPTMKAKDHENGEYEKKVVDAFNASQDKITVKFEMIDFQNGPEKITASIAGGTAPDIIFDAPGRIIEWGKSGNLAPLDDMFTAEFKADMLSEQLLSSCSDGKNYYMYPISAAPFTMALNKTILEKEGLISMAPTTGDRTWTTEQYKALAIELQKKGYKGAEIYCGGQGGDQGTRAFITNLYGASITKPDLTAYSMDTPEAVKGVQFCLDGVNEGWIEPNTAGVANDALDHFNQGLVSATVLWGPGLAAQRSANLKNSGTEALSVCQPSDDGVPVLEYLVNGFCVFDNKDADKIAASKEFIKFVCDDKEWGPKDVVATGCFPVRKSFGDLYPGDAEMAFYAGLTKYYGHYYNTINGYASMRPLWWGSLQAVLTKEKTPADAMKAYTADANKTIAEG